MNAWIKSLIELARGSDEVPPDDEAARALVGWLAECLRADTTPPPDLAAYFAQAFERVASGSSADKMLNLGKHDKSGRDYEVARTVWMVNHRAVDPLPLRSSRDTERGAYDVVAERFRMSAANVELIYKSKRRLVEDEFLEDSASTEAKAKRHAEIQHCIVYGKLAESLKKQGRK